MQLGKERAVITVEKVQRWYDDFRSYMQEEDPDILKDPTRIYNADESGFPLCPKSGKVLGLRGAHVVYNYTSSDKTQITVLACVSAVGHYIQPMIVFPGQRFGVNLLEGFEEAAMGRSDNGWMDAELFVTWIRDVFIPGLDERKTKKPVLLLVDGHSTHLTLEVSDLCKENGIILYCLLEHASHLIQPLDLRFFSSLKESWKQAVRDFQIENVPETVTKRTFARVFHNAWDKSATLEIALKAFRDSGIFPLEESVVFKSAKLEPSKLFSSTSPSKLPLPDAIPSESSSPCPTPTAEVAGSAEPEAMCAMQTHTTEGTFSAASTKNNDALLAFEAILNEGKITLFKQRYAEGYGKYQDELYDTWNELKRRACEESLQSTEFLETTSPVQAMSAEVPGDEGSRPIAVSAVKSNAVSSSASELNTCNGGIAIKNKENHPALNSPLSTYLKVPSAKKSNKKGPKRVMLPKAVTGKKFREIMQERQEQKEAAATEKLKRQQERELKKKQKEEEKERKMKEREAKAKRLKAKRSREQKQSAIRKAQKRKLSLGENNRF